MLNHADLPDDIDALKALLLASERRVHERGRHAAQLRNPALRWARVRRDEVLTPKIERVWQANMQVYGADKCGGNCIAKASMSPAARWSA